MLKKSLSLLLVLVLVLGTVVGCGTPGTDNDTDEGTNEGTDNGDGEKIKIAMVTDFGGISDESFNQSAWEGLQRAQEELEIKATYKESEKEADYGPNLENLLDEGNDLIWGIGFNMSKDIEEAAEKNPDQKYAIIDFAYDDTPENLVGVVFEANQASFLVGYIAGKMTETNKVGFVGGVEGNVIDGFDYGFHAGVKYANPDAEVIRQYAESFVDSTKGKAIANSMYQDGADIVFHAAGGVGNGVIEAAKEQDKWAIGVDRDQSDLAPENVLTSAVKRVDIAMFDIAERLQDGKFPGGETIVYGLDDDGVGIAPTSDKHVPEDILAEVEEIKQSIIDGEIVVPYNEDTYEEFEAK
ncbi:BMP family ABC transporter substrate-binding protein [Clostridium sp. D2Q-11]|uniref:BMP family ABC transporter substrate-binding protein n=1 Tax=Anaeromonas frigoriresistens TaxID=2683708 RepID=A0A942UVQ5_9FIRM|nr:BMP family ABC transporter substrate-binding protein [Anaeromonas frigoriresistens]MBS4537776.1 BMP family ABC transporter substrate-binding protein [Anaeromonas frigoriresistens]